MQDERQYKLWDVIEVHVDRSKRDQRPESFKIDPERLARIGHIPTDKNGWAARRELIERSTDWHYPSMSELRKANAIGKTSIGLITPGSIEQIELTPKQSGERAEFLKKCQELRIRKESDMFDPLYQTLDFLPNEIFLHWMCAKRCETCSKKAHRMKVLDWGLMQLARKKGWDAAVSKLEEISNPRTHDFRIFLGNFAQHPSNFGVIALWYPPRTVQTVLL
jgi:hypothetical protein